MHKDNIVELLNVLNAKTASERIVWEHEAALSVYRTQITGSFWFDLQTVYEKGALAIVFKLGSREDGDIFRCQCVAGAKDDRAEAAWTLWQTIQQHYPQTSARVAAALAAVEAL